MGILRACLNKRQYPSAAKAYEAGVLMHQRPYPCPYCLKYHLTTKGVSRKWKMTRG